VYGAAVSFEPEVLRAWAETPEIEIETSRGPDAPVHRTVIWIVVDGGDAYVRSVRGPAGRWYRELRTNPRGAVHAAGNRVAVEAQPATDEATIARVSESLREKYHANSPSTRAMLREHTLSTTLRLRPTTPPA
jgi:hypothetical protein